MPIRTIISEDIARLTVNIHVVLEDEHFNRKGLWYDRDGVSHWQDIAPGTETPVTYSYDTYTAVQIYQAMRLHYGDAPDPLLRKDFERERQRVDKLTQTLSELAKFVFLHNMPVVDFGVRNPIAEFTEHVEGKPDGGTES